jgi:hypothetical protein
VHGQPLFAGLGRGGQYLFCIPRHNLVMVILSRPIHAWPDRWIVLDQLLQYLESGSAQ